MDKFEVEARRLYLTIPECIPSHTNTASYLGLSINSGFTKEMFNAATLPVLFQDGRGWATPIVLAMCEDFTSLKNDVARILDRNVNSMRVMWEYPRPLETTLSEDNITATLRLIKERGSVVTIYAD